MALLGKIGKSLVSPLARLAKTALAPLAPVGRRVRAYAKPAFERAQASYQRLEPREKRLVRIASALSAAFLGYNLIYLPIQNLRQDLNQRIQLRQHETVQVARLVHDYRQLGRDLASAEKRTVRDKDFDLFSVVDGALTGAIGADKIGGIDRTDDQRIAKDLVQHKVVVNLKSISLTQLVDALYGITTLSQPILVSNIHIRKSEGLGGDSFDVDMTLVATARNG
jgi:type II secretory pathway component PulM